MPVKYVGFPWKLGRVDTHSTRAIITSSHLTCEMFIWQLCNINLIASTTERINDDDDDDDDDDDGNIKQRL